MEYSEEYRNEKGQLHRADGPAIINSNYEIWYFNGEYHRIDGPAYIEGDYYKVWHINGERHRLDGPAYICNYKQSWWINHKSITNPEDYIHAEIKECIYET